VRHRRKVIADTLKMKKIEGAELERAAAA